MKARIHTEHSFEVWINNDTDSLADETGSFDDNWIVSAGDLFDNMALSNDESISYYDEVA
ncbi:hypothetical protein EXU85_28795 [Spirosoma sp. KCTC 42546]|uniref:hypothetical protein n=1 Tax=Spirosoma sp. KCTC 42546 TaxID=2520506 RepID=UPI00115BA4D7|nr:hypothetical protein [Spirosoma sp. KCTC 42546]QDK82391.1 hypothetical protein EXU85_28795 [Spirosoma sp. KCTC 42546]